VSTTVRVALSSPSASDSRCAVTVTSTRSPGHGATQTVFLAELARPRLVQQVAVLTEYLDPAHDALGDPHALTGAVQHPQRAADATVGESRVISGGVVVRVLPRLPTSHLGQCAGASQDGVAPPFRR
jgi:hypothetical protein